MLGNYGLIHQVESLPVLIHQQYEDMEPKARKVLTTQEIYSVCRIVLTGCGDSYAAALSVKNAFASLTGMPTEAVPAVELSRTVENESFGFAPNNPLVIAVSNSGRVARMNEAVCRAHKHGAFILAVTGSRDSPFAATANRIMDLSIPSFESAPGTRSYLVSLMALLLIAIRIGEVRGRYTMDTAMNMRYDMLEQARQLEIMLPDLKKKMLALAQVWKKMEAYDFIGTGMEFGTAWYCHAKILEQLGKYTFYQNSEDWLHTNLFLRRNTETATVVFSDVRNRALGRTCELIEYAQKLKRPLLVVGDGVPDDIKVDSILTPRSQFFFNSCMTQYTPVSILANYIANLIDETDGRGCEGVWSIASGAKCICESKVEIL